jgi:hypothetical protein
MKNFARFLRCLAVSSLASTLAACGAGDDDLKCPAGQIASAGRCVCADSKIEPLNGSCDFDVPQLPPIASSIVDSGGDTGLGLDMILDENDFPHVVYYEANSGDLRYASLVPGTGAWRQENVDIAGNVGRFPSVGLYRRDGVQRPVVAYYDETQRALKGAVRAVDGWRVRFLDPIQSNPLANRGTYTSLVVEAETNIAHITYIDVQNLDLMYLKWDVDKGEVGQPRLVDPGFSVVAGRQYGSGIIDEHTSIALDREGVPIIAYRDVQTGDLKFARYNEPDDVWNITFIDNNPLTGLNFEDVGQFATLAVDDLNNYHIAYHNLSGNSLRYAHFDGSDWVIENVARGNVGKFASLVIRQDRTPLIAFFDSSRGVARIAKRRRDGTWQNEIVATQGIPGLFMRLRLTRAGWPAIAHREYFSKNVLFDYVTYPVFD